MKVNPVLVRMDVARGLSEPRTGVDRENHVIRGVAIMGMGVSKDSRYEADTQTLTETVRLMQEKKVGLKARFDHPNASSQSMGTYVGRHKNARLDGNVVRADLHLSEAAAKAPQGDLYKPESPK